MLTFDNFLENKESIQSCGKYKHFTYNDPNGLFVASLDYNYLFGWSCGIYFPENPSVAISFEDVEDSSYTEVINSVNKCLPFFNKIKNEEGESVGFIIDDFKQINKGYYEYEDPNKIFSLRLNFNGKNYCELSAFFGKLGEKGISVFFEQDNIDHTLASFNQCLLTIVEMYRKITTNEKNS